MRISLKELDIKIVVAKFVWGCLYGVAIYGIGYLLTLEELLPKEPQYVLFFAVLMALHNLAKHIVKNE